MVTMVFILQENEVYNFFFLLLKSNEKDNLQT